MGAAEGRECWSWRKVRESGVHRDMHEENTSPMPLAGKMRRAEFHDFFQLVRLKDWSLNSLGLAKIETQERCPISGEDVGKQPWADCVI